MKLKNPMQIIVGLCALLVVVFIAQYVVLNSLENVGDKEAEEHKTVTRDPKVWDESWKIASKANSQEDLDKAEKMLTKSLKDAEKAGGNDSRLAAILNCLARVYDKRGKYSESETLYHRVLEIDEKVLGKEHKAIITDLGNLAVTHIKQKKYKEAEELFNKAIALDEKLYGKDHPKTAADISYMVLLYDIQGKTEEALKLAQKALAINEKALGKNSPVVAANLQSLALLNSRSGNYEEAEKLLVRAQDIWLRSSSINDPNLMASLANTNLLQRVFDTQYTEGTPDKSVKFPQEAFEQAKALRKQKKSKEAEALLKKNLDEARKAAVGQPRLAKYLVRLNNVLFDQGKDSEAIIFGEIACQIFDAQDPKEFKNFENWNSAIHSYLAMSYDRRGRLNMAQSHYVRAIDYSKRGTNVTSAWRSLLEKSLASVKSRIELENERVVATNTFDAKEKKEAVK